MKLTRTLTAALLTTSLLATGAHAATELHHYTFDTGFTDRVGSNDLSGGGGTPNVTSAAGQVAFGAGALNLDQSGAEEQLDFTTGLSYDGTAAWSMSWWGQRSALAGNGSGMIVGTDNNSNDFVWTPDNASVVQGLRVRDNSGASTDYDGFPDDNAYHHWAFSYDGAGSVTAYRDGVNIGTKAWSGDIDFDHVGAGTASQSNSFYGQIDELRIMSGQLSADEVSNLRDHNRLSDFLLESVADTYISSSANDVPQQTGDPDRMIANDVGSNTRYSFVRFDVSAYENISAARLELIHAVGANGAQEYEVFGLLEGDDDWVEALLTWDNSTNRSGSAVDLSDVFGGAALAEFADPSATNAAGDLIVAFDVDSGSILDFLNADADGLVSFLIAEKIVGSVDGSGDGWITREQGTLNPPRLLIDASEIPAPAALPAGLALIALAAARRRRA